LIVKVPLIENTRPLFVSRVVRPRFCTSMPTAGACSS
jgi:hypothetical protein